MSQNIVALIIFLALVALVVAGSLIFSALVDRSVKRERTTATRGRTNDKDPTNDSTQRDAGQSGGTNESNEAPGSSDGERGERR